jgi:hypothetical protein
MCQPSLLFLLVRNSACCCEVSEPVPGRELLPLKSSAFHGALFRQLLHFDFGFQELGLYLRPVVQQGVCFDIAVISAKNFNHRVEALFNLFCNPLLVLVRVC